MRVVRTLPAMVSLSSGETNDAFRTFTGSDAAWTELIHSDDKANAIEAIERASESREAAQFTARLKDREGRWHAMTVSGTPIDSAYALVWSANVPLNDHERILEHRARTQHAIARLGREMLRGNPDFLQLACRTITEIMDSAFTLAIGYDEEREEAILCSTDGLFHEPIGTRVPISRYERLAWTLRHEKPTVSKDLATESRFAHWSPVLDAGARSAISVPVIADDAPWGMLAAHARTPRDYSSADLDFLDSVAHLVGAALYRKRMENEIARQRQELRTILHQAPDTITRFDRDLRIVFTNVSSREHGWEPAELIGHRIDELNVPKAIEDLWMNAVQRTFDNEEACEFESPTSRSGKIIEVRLVPERDEDGRVGHVVSFARDVTEWHRAEADRVAFRQQLEQERRAASVSRLATTVAHEFNNVLMSISPYAEIIARGGATAAQLEKASNAIRTAVARGRRVTHDIMRFTRPAEPSLRTTELGAWLKSSAQTMRLGANVPLLLEIPPVPIYADIDPEQFDQAVTNLVFNARDAMAGRSIGVIRVRLSATDNEVSIAVEDDGAGIPSESMDKLFEPFFTTKRSGTGLGLAVVKQIVERHHGRIETENREGGGATFTIVIPARVRLAPPHEMSRPESVRGLRILLVEDESDVAEGIRLLLQDVRANVRTAPDGASGIRELEAAVPDVVLLDVGLPDIDGLQLFAQIRRRWPSLPIVFSTGHGDQARLDEALRNPRVGHVIKPYGLDELLAAIVMSLT